MKVIKPNEHLRIKELGNFKIQKATAPRITAVAPTVSDTAAIV
jgi:hypothetical protein